mmetsp:Transcript_19970/g.63641  ORF Transcript_19970/g.63641 Transcript_19970/m.63641 type:complete len:255 (-) Transcript_19970:1363-2127(-)
MRADLSSAPGKLRVRKPTPVPHTLRGASTHNTAIHTAPGLARRHPKCAGSPPLGWRQAAWRWPHAPAPSSLHRLNPPPVLHRVGRRRRTRCQVGRRRARRRLLRDGVRWREGRRCSLPGGTLPGGRLSRALPKHLPGRRLSRSLHGPAVKVMARVKGRVRVGRLPNSLHGGLSGGEGNSKGKGKGRGREAAQEPARGPVQRSAVRRETAPSMQRPQAAAEPSPPRRGGASARDSGLAHRRCLRQRPREARPPSP